MTKTFILSLLCACVAFGEVDVVSLRQESPSTTTTNNVTSTKRIYGQVQAIAVSCDTNVTITVTSTGGRLSIGGERTILGATAVTPSGLYTNLSSTVWAYGDRAKVKTKSSSSTTNDVEVVILTTTD